MVAKLTLLVCSYLMKIIYIYIYIYELVTVVQGDPMAPFSLATTPNLEEGANTFPISLYLPLIRTL